MGRQASAHPVSLHRLLLPHESMQERLSQGSFSSHEVLEKKTDLQTDGCRTVSHLLRWFIGTPPALNVPSVACFSLLWQPDYTPSTSNHLKKEKKILKRTKKRRNLFWSCFIQDVKPTNEPECNQPPVICLKLSNTWGWYCSSQERFVPGTKETWKRPERAWS